MLLLAPENKNYKITLGILAAIAMVLFSAIVYSVLRPESNASDHPPQETMAIDSRSWYVSYQ